MFFQEAPFSLKINNILTYMFHNNWIRFNASPCLTPWKLQLIKITSVSAVVSYLVSKII